MSVAVSPDGRRPSPAVPTASCGSGTSTRASGFASSRDIPDGSSSWPSAPTAAWVIPPAADRMPGRTGRTRPSASGISRRAGRPQAGGAQGPAFGLSVSPDGQKVLTGGDTRLILWDARTGKPIRPVAGHEGMIGNATFLPGGGLHGLGQLRPDDPALGPGERPGAPSLPRPSREVTWVAASPDGRRLLSSDYNGHELRLWDVEGHKLIRRLGWGGTAPTAGRSAPTAGTRSRPAPMGSCGCMN